MRLMMWRALSISPYPWLAAHCGGARWTFSGPCVGEANGAAALTPPPASTAAAAATDTSTTPPVSRGATVARYWL